MGRHASCGNLPGTRYEKVALEFGIEKMSEKMYHPTVTSLPASPRNGIAGTGFAFHSAIGAPKPGKAMLMIRALAVDLGIVMTHYAPLEQHVD